MGSGNKPPEPTHENEYNALMTWMLKVFWDPEINSG
jgi:hypothetical protein